MAISINSIPILQGNDAEKFQKKEKASLAARASVEFKKQARNTRAILKKAKM